MQAKTLTALGLAAAILAGSDIAQAADDSTAAAATRTRDQTRLQTPDSGTRNELDQRNQIWSMRGATDGSYTGATARNRVQAQTREQARIRSYPGTGTGSRYGQGYESRHGAGSPGGSSHAGGFGGGRR